MRQRSLVNIEDFVETIQDINDHLSHNDVNLENFDGPETHKYQVHHP